jgi:hypothetical protein
MSPPQENIFEPIAVSLPPQRSTPDAAEDGVTAMQRETLAIPAGGLFEEPLPPPGREGHHEPPITVDLRGRRPAEPASMGPDTDLPPWRPRARRPAGAAEPRLRRGTRRTIRRAAIPVASALLSFLIATALIALLHGAPHRPASRQPSTPASDPRPARTNRVPAATTAFHHVTVAHAPRRALTPTRAVRTPGRRRAERASRPPIAPSHAANAAPPVAAPASSARPVVAPASPTPSNSAPAPPAPAPPVSASDEFGFEH